ncbi:unnamed protein product [Miscanthus lutarioriparius]|uniref:DUF4220 domain-containing protein n=1 Tax=Miscanthus lutarioriparius TaxID=422564 RepID=A0A811N857_9POAL|nr:unnamed protein product [Miscanthus lutarioriparius]
MVQLCCTASLEFLPLFLSPCILGSFLCATPVTGAEHNLMSFYTRRSKPTLLMRISALMGLSSYINKHWYIEQGPRYEKLHIIELVVEHVKQGWKLYIFGAPSYQRFCNLRGQWTVSRYRLSGQQLLWSLKVPFDRSVLVWHIATELCAYHPRTSAQGQADLARYSRAISNFMIYLLFVQPEMLMPGTRQGLFTAACNETELMLSYLSEPTLPYEVHVAEQILATARFPLVYPGTLVPEARDLAEELMGLLDDEEERWKVIQGVWVEMLCCSASRCRGYLHAKSMGESLELLTLVWLLLSRMGMEAFADKFQRPGPGQREDDIVTGASPSGLEPQEDIPVEEEISIV